MPVIPYDARAPYINVALKEYPYLSLYNSDRHMNLKIRAYVLGVKKSITMGR